MSIEEQIKQKIEAALSPTHIEVHNESSKHKGHAGDDGSGQTHFRLLVVSGSFEGLGKIQRHRLAYDAIGNLMDKPIHALSMKLFTPSEMER